MTTSTEADREIRRSQVIHDAAARLSIPREASADSFVLHAPLELMGRVGLLPFIPQHSDAAALDSIEHLANQYEASGPAADLGSPPDCASPAHASAALAELLNAGDIDSVDAPTTWLAEHCSHDQIRHALGELIVDRLAAAGHASIGLHLLPLVANGSLPSTLLRGTMREIARNADWRIRWFRDDVSQAPTTATVSIEDALRNLPMLGRPGSDFIYPIMSQVERSGVADRHLAPALGTVVDVAAARSAIQRAACWSMLHDDPTQAPYGWTHALTMSQAVLGLADEGVSARTAVAVALTFIAGFRTAHGTVELGDLSDDAVDLALAAASSAELASFAASHHDAHLVKYTLACLHAAEADPPWRHHYLAAATQLGNWWRAHDAAHDN